MKGKNVVITLLLILALLLVAVWRRWQEPRAKEPFSRSAPLSFTAFAVCQLKCKSISRNHVQEVMQKGMVLYNKSNRRRWPCPTYVVQARTINRQLLRVVFEQCDKKTTVLAIDNIEKQDSCNCGENR